MLSKSRRLRAAEVVDIIRSGKNVRAAFLSAKMIPSADGTIRAAAVVSKAVGKNAVGRNRLRRALYRAVASVEATGHAPKSGMCVVFFVRSTPPPPLPPTFAADIEHIFSSLKPKT